jgi:hypothetical protein
MILDNQASIRGLFIVINIMIIIKINVDIDNNKSTMNLRNKLNKGAKT